MTAFEAYIMFLALKRHFSSEKYDYFRYNGKVKANEESFNKRNDKYYFYKLSKKLDLEGFLVSNLVEGDVGWVGNLIQDKKFDVVYQTWRGRQESLSYNYKTDLSKLPPDFNEAVSIPSGEQYPIILQLYLHNVIKIESLLILDQLANFIENWTNIEDKTLWPIEKMKLIKYKPFIRFDREKFKQLTLNHFA